MDNDTYSEQMWDLKRDFESHFIQVFIKRAADVFFAVLLLIITSPVWALLAILIHREDGGSVFYLQTRCTRGGREFAIIKFRSMVEGAEEIEGVRLVSENDLRVTEVGRVLRRCRLDELPQLWNILRGDMSFVGPRPERPELIDDIVVTLPEFRSRMAVRAGLTGLAQIKGDYYTPFDEKLRWDIEYIEHFSLAQDIRIIFMTLPAVLKGPGADE